MDYVAFLLNLGVALALGMLIGLERQYRRHPAGLRTNALVCLGAALFVSLARQADPGSPTRIAAQVVSGIGFLGGGVILREGFNVRGMSTAATLWCSAGVGTLAGMGFLLEGALGTAAVLFVHLALRPVARRLDAWTRGSTDAELLYRMRVVCPEDQAAVVRTIFLRHVNAQPNMSVQGIATQDAPQEGKVTVVAEIYATERGDRYLNELVTRISIEPSVTEVSWERST